MGNANPFTIETFTASDGYRWRYRRFAPPGPPRGHVVCIHGIQSHGGWYTYSCTRLAQAGYVVSFLDRRGSGLNEKDRGDAPSFRRLLDDIAEYIRTLPRPTLPVFLIAISWGGKLGVAFQRRHPGMVDGLALLCPGFFPQFRASLWLSAHVLWAARFAPKQMFPVPLSEPELFTAVPRWRRFIAEDPLVVRYCTAWMGWQNGRLDGYLRLFRPEVYVPVLLMLAEHDRIIRNEQTRQYVQAIAKGECKIIEYPAAHHTLEFEPDPDLFIHDLQEWLETHSARPQCVVV
jgi:alpha-beta hydrolase superfamily lysophospholipase